jgi:2-keto-4-pentenoate hydratase/2-oxohepta-3-ene-1,7-dioic acid hydratase in catechol pathway
MKLFRYTHSGRTATGVCHPTLTDRFVDLHTLDPSLPSDAMAQLDQLPLEALRAQLMQLKDTDFRDFSGVRFELPVAHPPKIICMGLNYADHAKEGGNARPDYPSFFLRATPSLTAHEGPIVRPKVSTQLDYEAELAVIVGRKAKHLTPENALSCVFGYSCFNDGSIRDYQRKSAQWTIGKNFDETGGFGPWIVTADELPAGAAGLNIQSRLNGKVMQDANTRDFLWNVQEALVIISECMTLEPGDVIITGTPAGVGYARTPPVWMQPGDTIEVEIQGVGTLINRITASGH